MTVFEECKRRNGGQPCVKTYADDMKTITGRFDCARWCPLLRHSVDDQFIATERDDPA
jgi:hypothetical protein